MEPNDYGEEPTVEEQLEQDDKPKDDLHHIALFLKGDWDAASLKAVAEYLDMMKNEAIGVGKGLDIDIVAVLNTDKKVKNGLEQMKPSPLKQNSILLVDALGRLKEKPKP
jgi:hypothetical protein